jgi:hypothetical protein
MVAGPFYQTGSEQAKERIRIDYYLNSADEAVKKAEKRLIMQKARDNLAECNKRTLMEQSASQRNKGRRKDAPPARDVK